MTPAELRDFFGSQWPLIGVVHLLPLPGSPLYGDEWECIVARAVSDASAYQEAGFDGIIVENFGDRPFFPEQVPPETVAAMTAVALEVRRAVSIPVGINVLRNDARAALAVAAVAGGRFIRVNVHAGAMVTDQGVLTGRAWETMRVRRGLAPEIRVFADVHVKHGVPLADQDVAEAAVDTVERGLADALIVTGPATGSAVDLTDLKRIRRRLANAALIVGSGVRPEILPDLMAAADAAIVGTYAKQNAVTLNPVDLRQARQFVHVRNRHAAS